MYCSGTNNLFSNLSSKNINPLAAKSSHRNGILGPLYESKNFHTFFRRMMSVCKYASKDQTQTWL